MIGGEQIELWREQLLGALGEQPWFQSLKEKWEGLDAQSKLSVQVMVLLIVTVLVILITLNFVWSVRSLKKDLAEKREILTLLQRSNEEIARFSHTSPTRSKTGNDTWENTLQQPLTNIGAQGASLEVSPERPGGTTPLAQESYFDLRIKHINLRDLARYVVALERASRPIKVRGLEIRALADESGFLDADLQISGFKLSEKR